MASLTQAIKGLFQQRALLSKEDGANLVDGILQADGAPLNREWPCLQQRWGPIENVKDYNGDALPIFLKPLVTFLVSYNLKTRTEACKSANNLLLYVKPPNVVFGKPKFDLIQHLFDAADFEEIESAVLGLVKKILAGVNAIKPLMTSSELAAIFETITIDLSLLFDIFDKINDKLDAQQAEKAHVQAREEADIVEVAQLYKMLSGRQKQLLFQKLCSEFGAGKF